MRDPRLNSFAKIHSLLHSVTCIFTFSTGIFAKSVLGYENSISKVQLVLC